MSDDQRPGEQGRFSRRTGRAYVLGVIALVIVVIFGVLLGVGRCAPGIPDDDTSSTAVVEQVRPEPV
ncbi:hypothetical protein [Klenkia taihuensis]|uniref:Uncharacterized protein n=1 Tax=Klenkia taihuensis TaxID=1225127 RepID=A0A1I1QQD1_9ACTN|nr:hypothetical protein [Klenkia taihuensis]GHE07592.1 hypothetical protein GCM10011381_04670 [Klenkia taihuensis]SFD24227.1 hypothetical protein SAMN05661030_2902 [Klenkia taihuensis]